MGGDHGASPNVEGAIAAVRAEGARVILVGDEALLSREVAEKGGTDLLGDRLSIRHAAEVVLMDEKPSQAVRKKKGSSMRLASDLVKDGEACAVLSAGNSGAMMAVALLVFGRVEGVIRPAIATGFPSRTASGFSVLVDAGANTDCSPEHLLQFGVMGEVFLRAAYRQEAPKVGVVANGTEDTKGTDLTRGALALLRRTDLHVLGHVEGNEIMQGGVDVVVTDGFTGNVLLKTGEATARFVGEELKRGLMSAGLVAKLGGLLAKRALKEVAKRMDAREFGAAPLLGVAAPVFIAHGSSDAYTIQRAICRARDSASHDITGRIGEAIQKWRFLTQTPPAPSTQHA
jgi:phosphate acyltransferase